MKKFEIIDYDITNRINRETFLQSSLDALEKEKTHLSMQLEQLKVSA